MNKQQLQAGLILCISILLFSCGNISEPSNTKESESLDTAKVPEVDRIVALSSLTADLVQQLSPEKLVGITGSSLLNDDSRFSQLPKVSSGRTPPNLEKIVALEPDLVLGSIGFHDKIAQRLEEIGISTQLVEVKSWSKLTQMTEVLANQLNADPQPLLKRYQSCLDKAPDKSDATVLALVSRQPILSPNKTSWSGDFLRQFNVNNLAANLQGKSPIGGYVSLSAENIIKQNPDVLIIVDPRDEGLLEQLKKDAFWGQLNASKNQGIHILDYYGFINPGSVEKIEEACTRLSQILM